jgi:hypothetical protein
MTWEAFQRADASRELASPAETNLHPNALILLSRFSKCAVSAV